MEKPTLWYSVFIPKIGVWAALTPEIVVESRHDVCQQNITKFDLLSCRYPGLEINPVKPFAKYTTYVPICLLFTATPRAAGVEHHSTLKLTRLDAPLQTGAEKIAVRIPCSPSSSTDTRSHTLSLDSQQHVESKPQASLHGSQR